MLTCRMHKKVLILCNEAKVPQLQQRLSILRRIHGVKVVKAYFPSRPGSLERFLRESGVTLHPCKVEGLVHLVQVKF